MFSRTWIVNLVLAGLIVLIWANIWGVWRSNQDILFEGGSVEVEKTGAKKYSISQPRILEDTAYDVVVDNNLFSPDRTWGVEEIPEVQASDEQAKVSGRKLVLYGVILRGAYKTALINNPDPKSNNGKYLWVKEGDMVGDLRVAGIEAEKVRMVEKGVSYNVQLYDPDKVREKAGQARQTAKPEVIQTGQAAASSGSGSGSAGSSTVVAADKKKASTGSQPGGSGAAASGDGEYEIISTPFGKIKRKIQ